MKQKKENLFQKYKYFIPKPSDGFAEEESQYEVEKHIEDFSSIKIPKTSHYF